MNLNNKTGSITSYIPPEENKLNPAEDLPNWWTDDPSSEVMEEGHIGAKTVNQWRVEYLTDFAKRMVRCKSPAGLDVQKQEDNTMPDGLQLSQNYPNPFNPETEISFKINRAGYVSLKIYDLNGRLIKSLIDADINAGAHHVKWDSRDDHGKSVSSGTYLCTIKTNDAIKSIKLTFTK